MELDLIRENLELSIGFELDESVTRTKAFVMAGERAVRP